MTSIPLNIIFMGTPDFAVPALAALIDSPHNVIAVYSQPPRPKGRGQKVQPSPVHELANQHGIPVYTPINFKSDDDRNTFKSLNADVAVVAAYGLILPQAILDAPKYGCLNIHGSILPKWRGASPIQHAIWKGDETSGNTIMQMERGLDTGPMLYKQTTPITPTTTAQQLYDTLSAMGGSMILHVLENLHNITPEKQDDAQSTYAPMLRKEDGLINWQDDAINIDRQIRALNPWPGTYTHINGTRLKILCATLDESTTGPAGKILDKSGLIACGKGALRITKLQPDGTKSMDFASALNGKYLAVNDILS